MNTLKPSLFFLLIGLIPFPGLASNSSINEVNDSILYNWAISGLNIRTADNINADKVGAIPYGEPVVLLNEPEGREYSMNLESLFSIRNSINESEMHLEGNWVKIRYNAFEGYVFNGFLSSLPPMESIKDDLNNIRYDESFQRYLERNFGSNYTGNEEEVHFHEFGRKSGYSNGATYEKYGKVGWYEEVLILPDVSLNEGKLLITFIYRNENVEVLEESEKPTIIRQNRTQFSVGIEGETYELYQFGSTLVIVVTRSC